MSTISRATSSAAKRDAFGMTTQMTTWSRKPLELHLFLHHHHRQPTLREALPQHLLVELAYARLRHFLDDRPAFREPPADHPVSQEDAQVLQRRGRALLEDDSRQRPFVPALFWHGDH